MDDHKRNIGLRGDVQPDVNDEHPNGADWTGGENRVPYTDGFGAEVSHERPIYER